MKIETMSDESSFEIEVCLHLFYSQQTAVVVVSGVIVTQDVLKDDVFVTMVSKETG